MLTLKHQGTVAFIWDFFGKVISKGLGFLVTIFLARLLEPSDFGLIAIIMVIVSVSNIFTDIGLSGAIIQRKRILNIHYNSVFYFNIFMGFLLSVILYYSAAQIALFYNNEKLLPLVQITSCIFLINSFSSLQTTILRKKLNYRLLTKINIISAILGGFIGIILALNNFGVWSLIIQILLNRISYNILIWYSSSWKPSILFSLKALKQLWGFGFRMFLSTLINTIYTKLDYLIIGKLFPSSILGYFQNAKTLQEIVTMHTFSSLAEVLFPTLSKIQNDLIRFQNVVLKLTNIIIFVTLILLGSLYVSAHELIIILYSDKWLPSVKFFEIFILSSFAYPLSMLFVNILSSRGNSKDFLKLEIYKKIIGSLSLLILYFYGINIFLYTLILQAIINGLVLNVFFVVKEIKISFLEIIKPVVLQILLAIVSGLIVIQINENNNWSEIITLFIKSTEYIVIYIILNKMLNTKSFQYSKTELQPILNKLNERLRKIIKC